jgi:hypothetical protein
VNILTRVTVIGNTPRIVVSDGQGTVGTYLVGQGVDPASLAAHRAAARQFLLDMKGAPGNTGVQLVSHRSDGLPGFLLAPTGSPERVKPTDAANRVASYLEGRRAMPNTDQKEIHGIFVHKEDEVRQLLVSDLRALIDYVREA